MENMITNIDFEKLSYEQLIQFEEKTKEYKQKSLDRRVAELEDWKKKYVAETRISSNEMSSSIKALKEENEKLRIDNIELKNKVFVLRNDQDGKYNEFKRVCMARVHKIVGKKGSDKYILFFKGFSQKIYNDVSRQLFVSNSGNIKTEDVEGAKVLAGKWRPSKKYIRETYDKYFTQYENGTLTGEKLLAFQNYKEFTEGGKNLEF